MITHLDSFLIEQVKQNLYIENDEQPTPQKIKKTEKSSPYTRKINHLNKNVIGQIGGEMLINLNSSAGRKNKMLGIISQETYITFVYLKCKADIEIKDNMMKQGDKFLKGGHILRFSEPYNFLDPELCEHLIVPLLLLGFLQNCELPECMTL